ncbi:MAG: hypothetical protein WCH11_05655, partial [Bdellovibrio sp.]
MKTWLLSFICLLAILIGLLQTGCSSIQKKSASVEKPVLEIDGRPAIRFSENPLAPGLTQRKYERITKQRLEEESDVQANAGSLWVMEGQGAYLFAQNKVRKEGDVLNIRIEGAAQKQIESKVSVIRKLLKQLEEEEVKRRAAAEAKESRDKGKETSTGDGNLAQTSGDAMRLPAGGPPAAGAEGAAAGASLEKEEPMDL